VHFFIFSHFFFNSTPIKSILVFLFWLINKNILKAIGACSPYTNMWEVSMLFVWRVWQLPITKHALSQCRWKHCHIIFLVVCRVLIEVGWFIASKFFSFFFLFFSLSFPKKYNLVFYVFCVSISVAILLIFNFFSWSFYKKIIFFIQFFNFNLSCIIFFNSVLFFWFLTFFICFFVKILLVFSFII